jgi:hypothetical protein
MSIIQATRQNFFINLEATIEKLTQDFNFQPLKSNLRHYPIPVKGEMMIEIYGFCRVENPGIMPVSQGWGFGNLSDDIWNVQ